MLFCNNNSGQNSFLRLVFMIKAWTIRVPIYKYGHSKTHCSKSSFFVQKFNFDFPRKLSIFWVKNSWKYCGFGLFSSWQLWFHEKNCQKKIGRKTRENVGVLSKLNFGFDAAKTLILHLSFIFQNQDCQNIRIENRDPLKMRLESWRKSVDFPHKQGWSAETLTIRIGHQRMLTNFNALNWLIGIKVTTLFEIFIFLSKNSTLISREHCQFLGGEKLVKMLWFWTF